MKEDKEAQLCKACKKNKVFTTCSGCGNCFCESCLHMQMDSSGCGSVWVSYYCDECVDDEKLNPNAAMRTNSD
ncbi:MAG: hypothetical protein K9K75_06530 [Deltaproteobacteria bacterium]|nr:hypothetical protein [Deltaproteobacteria bacterium]